MAAFSFTWTSWSRTRTREVWRWQGSSHSISNEVTHTRLTSKISPPPPPTRTTTTTPTTTTKRDARVAPIIKNRPNDRELHSGSKFQKTLLSKKLSNFFSFFPLDLFWPSGEISLKRFTDWQTIWQNDKNSSYLIFFKYPPAPFTELSPTVFK